MKQCNNSVM